MIECYICLSNILFQLQATLQRNSPEPDPTERDDVDVLLDELVSFLILQIMLLFLSLTWYPTDEFIRGSRDNSM